MSKTRKLNKALALFLMLALMLSLIPMTVMATGGTITGTGTQSDPYIIADASDLATFRTNISNGNTYSGKYVKLTADITTAQTTVIAPSADYPFAGTFDGDGHTITVNLSGGSRTALFGYVSGTIQNLKVAGSVTSTGSNSGGIVGYLNGGSVLNCGNMASVSASGGYSGGVVGYTGGTCTIDGCYNTGAISGGTRIGGVVGEQYYNVTVSNCYNMGSVTGTSTCNGGVVGYSRNAVTNCYHAVGAISTSYNGGSKGAIIGLMLSGYGSVVNCYYVSVNGIDGINGGDTTGVTPKTVAAMQAAASDLGNYYTDDITPNINNGYPILYWQGGGSGPNNDVVDALNAHVLAHQDEFGVFDELSAPMINGSVVVGDVLYLTPYSPTITVDGNNVVATTLWTSSNSNAVAVPSAGNGTAAVTHSDNGDVAVTMTAYLKAVVDGVTYVSTANVQYSLIIQQNLGDVVTYTVYVSVFSSNKNSPTVTGNNSRLMVAAPVSVTSYANTICVDDALRQLHATYYSGGASGYTVSNGMITKLWGSTNTNNAFGIYRNNILTDAVTMEPIANGDMITVFAYNNTSSYSDRYLCLNPAIAILAPGSSMSLPSQYKTYNGGSGTVTLSSATVYKLNGDGSLSSTSDISYNRSSKTLSATSSADGNYVVYGTYTTLLGTRYVPAVTRVYVTTSTGALAQDAAALNIDTAVESYIDLPDTGVYGSTITWSSSNTSVITNDGLVIRPMSGTGTTVTLTATLAYGGNTTTKAFQVTVTPQVAGTSYSTYLPGLTTTVSAMLTDEASFLSNMWILMDIIREGNTFDPTDAVTYHGYLESYVAATISGVTSNTLDADIGSSNLAKAVIILRALGYTSNDTIYSDALTNMESYAGSVLSDITDANSITDDELDYIRVAAFVLMADMQECTTPYTASVLQAQLRDFITSNQTIDNTNGYWTDHIDDDAMALVSLGMYSKYDSSNNAVNSAITRSLSYLASKQLANGSFAYEASGVIGNANSTAFVLIALVAVKSDPTMMTNNGRSVLDGVMMFYDNGKFQYKGIANDMATEQCYRALLAEREFAKDTTKAYVIYDFHPQPSKKK